MELKILRTVARLTQKQLGDLAGVDDSTISVIESGKRDIRSLPYATVVRIAHALGVAPDRLWPVEPLHATAVGPIDDDAKGAA
jgi:transcriptional regulator with XRE-family HTH domain